jgi:hypothetical protein
VGHGRRLSGTAYPIRDKLTIYLEGYIVFYTLQGVNAIYTLWGIIYVKDSGLYRASARVATRGGEELFSSAWLDDDM